MTKEETEKKIEILAKEFNEVVDDYCIERGVWSY